MNGDKAFVDTNVLLYAVDTSSPAKRARAVSLLAEFAGSIVISTQVLLEFYVTATRKLAKPLLPEEAERRVHELSGTDVVEVTVPLVRTAVALSREHRLSLWDALIVESARARGCRRLFSEDLQHGREFGIVRVENPFR
jgi:predicted nucleic acid-binding protein